MESGRMFGGFCIDNLPAAKSCPQNFQNPDQFPGMASSFIPDIGTPTNGFHPFDPFFHGSVGPAMQDFQSGGFLNFPDWKDPLMESSFMLADGLGCHEDGVNGIQNNNSESNWGRRNSRAAKDLWTPDEDRLLIQLVAKYGLRKWSTIACALNGRAGKQCRERWHNHLRPNIKKDAWTEEEDRIFIDIHKRVGNRWSEIAKSLPGRTENSIKNHWFAAKRMRVSRRRYNAKWPQPSTILLNYINGNVVSGSYSNTQNVQPHPVSPNAPQNPGTGTCQGGVTWQDYDIDDVLAFASADAPESNMHMSESFLNDNTAVQAPAEFNMPCFDVELPVDLPPMWLWEGNNDHGFSSF